MKKHNQLTKHYEFALKAKLEGDALTALAEIERCLWIETAISDRVFEKIGWARLSLIHAWAAIKIGDVLTAQCAVMNVLNALRRDPTLEIDREEFEEIRSQLTMLEHYDSTPEGKLRRLKQTKQELDARSTSFERRKAEIQIARSKDVDWTLSRELASAAGVDLQICDRLVKKSIRLSYGTSSSSIWGCKLGGSPALPRNHAWPRSRDGVPLSFLCQLNLLHLPKSELPEAGFLFFFYDADEQPWCGSLEDYKWKVLFTETCGDVLTVPPLDVPSTCYFMERGIEAWVEETAPCIGDAWAHDFGMSSAQGYANTLDAIYGAKPWHRMFGHPQCVQNSVEEECDVISERTQVDWIMLLQLDSDEEVGMCWGDLGRLYFMIDRDDLQARNFDAVFLILQCT